VSAVNRNQQEPKVISIPFCLDDQFFEMLVKFDGECDYLAMDEFLSSRIKHYRIEMFSNDTLKSIGRQLYQAVTSETPKENLELLFSRLTPIIED